MTRLKALPVLLLGACVLATGCHNAPNIDVVGSFFPVWMLCITIAVPLTFVVRYFLLRYHIENHVGPLALFYLSVVILFSCLIWLIFYR